MKRLGVAILGSIFLFSSSLTYAYAPFGRLLCKTPAYNCVKVPKRKTWETLFPDAKQRALVMALNRMNTPLYSGMLIAVPKNLGTANLMEFSPFPSQIKAPGQKIIYVDPAVLAWGAYDSEGKLVRWGPASLGSDWCHDLGHRCHSPVGNFHVYQKGTAGCRSTKFPLPHGGAPMPYCMFFHRGFALHGEPGGLPGDNVSHGCVRLLVSDAEWLSKEFVEPPDSSINSLGTQVVVEPYGSFSSPHTSKLSRLKPST
jgi:hypothetical protein